jgi:hypothetical protein
MASTPPKRWQTACNNGFLDPEKKPTVCLWAGLIIGLGFAVLGEIVGFWPSGHQLNDPMLLGLAIGSLLRGFTYFDWFGFFIPVIVNGLVGSLTWLLVTQFARRSRRTLSMAEVRRAVSAAVLVGLVPVLVSEISGFQVLLWYAVSFFLASSIAGMTAGFLHRWLYQPELGEPASSI